MSGGKILEVKNISKYFGGVRALEDVSFEVQKGQIFSLIGPNGAGKTTLFNIITGLMKPTKGEVLFHASQKSSDLTRLRPDQISRAGIARTFQNIRLFTNLTIMENVKTAFHQHARSGLFSNMFGLPKARREERDVDVSTINFINYVGITDVEELADNLAYGQKRRLEIARALATHPELLLLDEPAAGMNPTETAELMALIRKIRDAGISIFLIEHDMEMVMEISDYIVVLDYGGLIAAGKPAEVKNNQAVIEAYLGTSHA